MALYDPGEQRMVRWGHGPTAGPCSVPRSCLQGSPSHVVPPVMHFTPLYPFTSLCSPSYPTVSLRIPFVLHCTPSYLIVPFRYPFVPFCIPSYPFVPRCPPRAACPAWPSCPPSSAPPSRRGKRYVPSLQNAACEAVQLPHGRAHGSSCPGCVCPARGTSWRAVVSCPALLCPWQTLSMAGAAWHCARDLCSLLLRGTARLDQSMGHTWGYWSEKGSVCWELAGAGHKNQSPSRSLPMADALQPIS